MAGKLRDVDGTPILTDDGGRANQDFILVDHPVFFIRNVADYVAFSRAFVDGAKSPWRKWLGFQSGRAQV